MPPQNHPLRRREFLVATTTFVAAASTGLAGKIASAMVTTDEQQGEHRILSLRLMTAAPLDKMRDYYGKMLGLEIVGESETELEIRAGRTQITFSKTQESPGAPFYHFAFNIPENKVKAAHDWQAERGPLMQTPPHMRDRNFPPQVRHFRNWNAHSVFFWDPAGNILEYIGRHTLENPAPGPFTTDDILYASEIAFVTDDVPTMASAIEKRFELPQYQQGNAGFRAVGDEHGLLLVFKRGRSSGAMKRDAKTYDVYPAAVKIRSAESFKIPDSPYGINAAS